MPVQLVLPLETAPSLGRDDFISAPGNAQALALIDSWPDWPVGVAAIFGPSGSGKSHLVSIWRERSGARVLQASSLETPISASGPVAIEDIDSTPATEARDIALFALLERASPQAPVLLTGREAPADWPTVVPDLASRFSAVLNLPLWAPNDDLLAALACKLLADRQLTAPAPVIEHIVHSLERSPQAIREFIAKADAQALSRSRPISVALVRELIAEEDEGLS